MNKAMQFKARIKKPGFEKSYPRASSVAELHA